MNTNNKVITTCFSTNEKQLKTSLLHALSQAYLNAAKVIADVSLHDGKTFDALGLPCYTESDQYQFILGSLINSILEKHNYSLICSSQQLSPQLHLLKIDLPEHDKSPDIFPHGMTSEQTEELFFGEPDDSIYNYTSSTCARGWDIRGGLFIQMARSLSSIERHLFGTYFKQDNGGGAAIFSLHSKYSDDSRKLIKRELLSELKQVPDSFAQACNSPRAKIAKKLNDNEAGLDLIAIKSEETINILCSQLAYVLSSKINRAVTVKLRMLSEDEPDGYIYTNVPDEASLKAVNILMSRKSLPRELKKFIRKSNAAPWFCKNIQAPEQEIVIFENVAFYNITIAEQLIIHIGEPKA
jgi:hypothetical protein